MLAVSSIEKLQFSGLLRVGAAIDSLLHNVGVQHAVDGYRARTNRQQEQASEQHGIVGACFMRHRPKAGRFINASPKTEDCCEHGDDQRDSRQTGEETYDQQGSADNFNQSCEWSEQPGGGNTKFGEKASMGKRNFWMPSKRKTPPTAKRINKTAAGALLLIIVMLLAVGFLPGAICHLGRKRQKIVNQTSLWERCTVCS